MTALESATRVILDLLARREYDTAERITRSRRLSASELEQAVLRYGRTIVSPGDGWWSLVDITPIQGTDPPEIHIAAPVWTAEEGRSDLTLELRLREVRPGTYETMVEDLHVL